MIANGADVTPMLSARHSREKGTALVASIHTHARASRTVSVNQRIFHAFLRMSSALLLIRIIGMVNQIVVTAHFGAGADMDAYFVASAFPTLVASLLGGALEAAVVPAFARERARKTPEQVSRFFSTMLNLLIVSTVIITILLIIFRRQMIFVSAPGLDPQRMGLAVWLAPVVFPTFLLLIGVNFIDDILNAEGEFGWPAYAGIAVPLTTVVFVLASGGKNGVVILAIGAVAGLLIQLGVVIYRLRGAGLHYQPIMDVRSPELMMVFIAAWPALCSAVIGGASPFVDQIFASGLSAGSISALSYALKLISVPTGVVFAAIGRAALPYLSRQAAASDFVAFKATLRLYLWVAGGITTLIALFMLVAAHPIVEILFQRGAFTADYTDNTAVTLQGFVIGLVPMALAFVTARAWSAMRNTRVPMYAAIISVFANALFDFIFAHLWQSFGIALATSLVYICSTTFLIGALRREIGPMALLTPPPELIGLWRRLRRELRVRMGRAAESAQSGLHVSKAYLEEARSRGIAWLSATRQRVIWAAQANYQTATVGIAEGWVSLQMSRKRMMASVRAAWPWGTTNDWITAQQQRRGLPARDETAYAAVVPEWFVKALVCSAVLIGIVALAIASVYMSFSLALRIAVGVPFILALWRYPYLLLAVSAGVQVLFGSSLSFLSGNNLATALTLPGVLLLLSIPLKDIARRLPALYVWSLFMVWVLAGIGISGLDAVTFLKSWMLDVNYVIIAALIIHFVTTRKQLMGLIDIILVVSFFIAVYGIYGYVTKQHGQIDPSTGLFRISSIFDIATALSFYLTLIIPLAVFRITTLKGVKQLATSGLLLVLLLTLGLTFSRTALVAVAFCVMVQVLFLNSRRMKVAIFGGGALVSAGLLIMTALGYDTILSRFLNSDLGTLNGRVYLWNAVIDHFDPTQILGHGMGAAEALLTALQIGDDGFTTGSLIGNSPHNLFLGTLYDQGIIGAILLTVAFIVLLINLFKCALAARGEHRVLAATALAVGLAAVIQSVDSNQLMIPELGLYLWIVVALPFVRYWSSLDDGADSTSAPVAEPPTRAEWRDPALQRSLVPVAVLGGQAPFLETSYRHVADVRRAAGRARHNSGSSTSRIFFAVSEFHPSLGGTEQQVRMQARMFRQRGYATTVMTFRHVDSWKQQDTVDGIPVVRVGGWLMANRAKRPAVLRKLSYVLGQFVMAWSLWRRRGDYDLLHVYQANLLSLFAALTCRITGKPIIVSVRSSDSGDDAPTVEASGRSSHGGDLEDLARFGPLAVRLYRYLLTRDNAVMVSLSSRMRSYVEARGFGSLRSQLIPNGVDTTRFTPAQHSSDEELRARTAICVAKLRAEKGHDVLLRAWRLVLDQHPEVRLILVGDGPLMAQLKQLAADLGVAESVEFTGRRTDIPQQLHRAGVAILSSRYEGMPNTVLEAMASGLPCVATRVSGAEDIIRDDVNGLLVEPGDAQGLADALIALLGNPTLSHALGRAARTTIERRFEVERIMDRYESLYQRQIRRGQRS